MPRDSERAQILRELLRISRLSTEAAEIVLPRVRDEGLRAQIERQQAEYRSAEEKSKELLRRSGLEPVERNGLLERALRGSVRMDAALNRNPRHFAQLAINGTATALNDLTRTMERSPDDDLESRKFAEEYLDAGQRDIESLKKFL